MTTQKIEYIKKRDGSVVPYEEEKLAVAIYEAAKSTGYDDRSLATGLANAVTLYLERYYKKEIPTSDELREMVEKILFETGHAKIAKAYILYRANKDKVRTEATQDEMGGVLFPGELIVDAITRDEISTWGKERIAEALAQEASISGDVALDIASSVEQKIFKAGLRRVSTSLIRELVNHELFSRGLSSKLKRQLVVGLPKHDLRRLISPDITSGSGEIKLDPEQLCLTIGENTLRQYALQEIFSRDVADAHLEGRIHIHNLDYPMKLFWVSPSVEYIRRYGVQSTRISSVAEAPKAARTLTTQLELVFRYGRKFFSEALEFNHANVLYAPLLEGMDTHSLDSEAAHLVIELGERNSRGFSKKPYPILGINLGVPSFLRGLKVVSAFGKDSNKVFGDYDSVVYRFTEVLLEYLKQSDMRQVLYLNRDTFEDERYSRLLKSVCQSSIEQRKNLFFIFEREREKQYRLSRYSQMRDSSEHGTPPEESWYSIAQAVTVNLPQAFYRANDANQSKGDFYSELEFAVDMAIKAHLQKKQILAKYINKDNGTFGQQIGWSAHGSGALQSDEFAYVINFIGLNEVVKLLCDRELGEDEDSIRIAHRIVSFLYFKLKEAERKFDLRLSLEDLLFDESLEASDRCSRIDTQIYPRARGLFAALSETKRYSSSFHVRQSRSISLSDRFMIESRFHTLISSGSVAVDLFNHYPLSSQDLFHLLYQSFYDTKIEQFAIL